MMMPKGDEESNHPKGNYASVNGLKMYCEIHGTGRPLIPLSFDLMADDVAALIEHLGFEKADVMGYSLGGSVALRTAVQHPEVVQKLVLVSTPFKRDGWYPEVLAGMGQMGPEAAEPIKQTPMYQLYASVAPNPEDWPVLLTKLGQLLGEDYD